MNLKDVKNLTRKQRHDFMNMLHIVYGYLQLDRKEDAIIQINKTISTTDSISQINKISVFSIVLFLENKLLELENIGLDVSIEVNTPYEGEYRKISNEEKLIKGMKEKIDYLLNSNNYLIKDKTHIKIIEESNCLNIIYRENVIKYEFEEVKSIQIKDSIYSKIYSNTI